MQLGLFCIRGVVVFTNVLCWSKGFNFIKIDCICSVPLGAAKTRNREELSRAAGLSLPVHRQETCSGNPSEEGRGSAAPEAPRTSPQTSRCRSMADHCFHPPTVPNRKSTQRAGARTKREESVEATEAGAPLRGAAECL